MKQKFKRVIALVAAVVIVFSALPASIASALPSGIGTKSHIASFGFADGEVLEAIVVMKDDAVADLGLDPDSTEAAKYEQKLLAKQEKLLDKLDGDVTVSSQYTELLSGVCMEATAGQLREIEGMAGVRGVYLVNHYILPETEICTDEKLTAIYAAQATGAQAMNTTGYNGDGIVVAVIDTGINIAHEAFKTNELIKNPALTKEMIESIDTVGKGAYVSAKLPFCYDYYNKIPNCNDELGHGTHVAGIIGGYCPEKGFSGAAPAVQLLGMRVMNSQGGTDSRIYLDALEDCYRLGADVVNMSLGADAGFSYRDEDSEKLRGEVFEKLDKAGISVICSAGNATDTADMNTSFWNTLPVDGELTMAALTGISAFPTSYTDLGVVGDPSSCGENLSVASANDPIVFQPGIKFAPEGESYAFCDADLGKDFSLEPFWGKETEFVYIDAYGAQEDFEGVDVEGKVVALNRGIVPFQNKSDNAAAAGAVLLIVVNNVPDDQAIKMSIPDPKIPALWVEYAAKDGLLALSGKTITLSQSDPVPYPSNNAFLISSFSSRGPLPDLLFKPEVTGIGGHVYSTFIGGTDSYAVLSGTSMACPNVVGTFAVILQYIREQFPEKTKYEQAAIAEDRMVSTANELINGYGFPYSPRAQGAGLVNAVNAVTADAYITGSTVAAGDDPDLTGEFELCFSITNVTEETHSYVYGLETLIDEFAELPGYGFYNTGESVLTEAMFGNGCVDIPSFEVLYANGNTVDDGSLVIAGGETVSITMTVAIDPDLAAFICTECGFENGFFFDGFVPFYDENKVAEAVKAGSAPVPECHATFIAYVGDWLSAPLAEVTDLELLALLNDPDSHAGKAALLALSDPETEDIAVKTAMQSARMDIEILHNSTRINGFIAASLEDEDADQTLYYIGGNFSQTPESIRENGFFLHTDTLRFSTADTDADQKLIDAILIRPAMLRNARYCKMTVTDSETGTVYFVDNTEWVRKDIYDKYAGEYGNYAWFYWDGSYTDDSGETKFVPSGTVADISIVARLDCPGAKEQEIVSFRALVDYEAPQVEYLFDKDKKQLTVKVTDNDLLAGVTIFDRRYDADPKTAYVDEAYDNETEQVYTFDVSDSLMRGCDELFVSVSDYATNESLIRIPLDKSNSNIPVEVSFDIPDSLSYALKSENCEEFGELLFTLQADEAHCFGEDFAVTVTQGARRLDVTVLHADHEKITCKVSVPASDEKIVVSATGVMQHDYRPTEVLPSDCTFVGLYEYRCANCGKLGYFGGGTASGHTKDAGMVLVKPTCEECGWMVYHCADCGVLYQIEQIESTGHTPGEPTVTKQPGYGTEGEETVFCIHCGKALETKPIAALENPDGDVTGDGAVNALDCLFVKAIVLGTATPTEKQKQTSDLNLDGKIDALDYCFSNPKC